MKVNKKAQAIEMVALNPGITNKEICHDKMYDREKTWPKESLERIK